jgi:signal peptidase I
LKKARKYMKEAARILKYRGSRLDADARKNCENAVQELRKAIAANDKAAVTATTETLTATFKPYESILQKATIREYVESMGFAIFVALLVRSFAFEAFQIPTGSMIPTLRISDHLFVNKYVFGLRIPFTHIDMISGNTPKPGEIIVFDFPVEGDDYGKAFIKRVIGVPGDRVKLENNQLFINGKPVPSKTVDSDADCQDASLSACRCERQIEQLGGVEYISQHIKESPTDRQPTCRNSPNWPVNNPMAFGSPVDNADFPEIKVPAGHVFCMGDNRDNSSDGRYWGFVPIENARGKASVYWWPLGQLFKKVQ